MAVKIMSGKYGSWGRFPKSFPAQVEKVFWRNEFPDLNKIEYSVLPYGLGKSYGDSCLNNGNALIDISGMNKLIEFNESTGRIKAEAGMTLAQVLNFILPKGYFLSVTPGTKHITLGGAIANDVHGKNHHKMGTFGCHVNSFELLRSNGQRLICSRTENSDLFKATIGGLGLTGAITWVEFDNQPCSSEYFYTESVKFDNLDEFFEINEESNELFDYTVSWVDTTASGGSLGRGLFNRGNHAKASEVPDKKVADKGALPFFLDAPFINSLTVQLFNILYFNKQNERIQKSISHYNPFFYPLDAVDNWNLAYGKNGFLQYQFVVPFENDRDAVKEILAYISRSGLSSFLTVLKSFGDRKSPGMLSFPRPGITMAVDFRMNGRETLSTLNELDRIVVENGGALYPAKDARMSGENFKKFYPQYEEFSKYIDPKFSSSFWRRVMA